ncbi:MAG: ABC transporter ATP-binding protein [Caldilinea sp. CFX5]|nr:ABC transporter ATP-binding protein [Caldilinea sp. CFX5]
MATVVQFDQVSKQYRLGVSRTSILKTMSGSLRKMMGTYAEEPLDKQVLWALRNICFTLAQGESLALIGRNGAGKSTLLKLLANITRPTSGQIMVNGRLSALIELGSGFHPDLTGRENIYMNGTILGLRYREIQRRLDEIVEFSEIARFIDTPVKRYSSGMLVRLGFAIASCIEPDILLVDEVLAVGDAAFAQKCLQRIQALLDKGTSLIFVSHNLYMVQSVCASALYIEQGQIKERGATSVVIDAYERDIHEERAKKMASSPAAAALASDVQITKIELLDKAGRPCQEMPSDAPIKIRVHYQAAQASAVANAVVRIIRTDGLTCCMMRTMLANVHLHLQQGEGAFSAVITPIQLTGGTYFVDARITNATDNVVLAAARSSWFYVSGLALSDEEDTGIFEPQVEWLERGYRPTGNGYHAHREQPLAMSQVSQRSSSSG